MALCRITGTVQLPDGDNAAGRVIVFHRAPETVTAQSGVSVIPDSVPVRVAQDGTVDFELYTGNYVGIVRLQRQVTQVHFKFPVPEAAAANFQDVIQSVDPVDPLPSWLQEAFDARDAAEAAQLAAEAAAEAANRAPTSWADFQAAPFIDLLDGVVVQFNGVQFVRDRSASIAGLGAGEGWAPLTPVNVLHFTSSWAVDVGPGLRDAVKYIDDIGGGAVSIPPLSMVATSHEDRLLFSNDVDGMVLKSGLCFVPAKVSLVGPGVGVCKIKAAAAISLVDYSSGIISGFEYEGQGDTNNASHGIINSPSSSAYTVMEDVTLSDLYVHHVGSYGIGLQYGGYSNVHMVNIRTDYTGSDGIDWKVKGPTGPFSAVSKSNTMTNVSARRFGQRVTGGSSTGIGIRGRIQADNINVYDIKSGQVGIAFMPGTSNPDTGDYRLAASLSSITNYYCEGVGPRALSGGSPIGLQVYSCDRMSIGPGVLKWCILDTEPAGTTPYGQLHGPTIRGMVIVPPHNCQYAARVRLNRTNLDVVIQSDYDVFDVRANTATVGQTVFLLPYGPPTANYAVVKNGVQLTLGVDYTVSGDTLTLTTGLTATDSLFVVYPPQRGVRIEALNVHLSGSADQWCPEGHSFATSAQGDACYAINFAWVGRRGVTVRNGATLQMSALSNSEHESFRISPKGANGKLELIRPKLPTIGTYADNAAAVAAGLTPGDLYRGPANVIYIVS